MSRITRELSLQHTRLQVLIQAMPDIAQRWLAPFERDLSEEVARRREAFGEDTPVSEAEAVVLRQALAGMQGGVHAVFSANRAGFADLLAQAEAQIGTAA